MNTWLLLVIAIVAETIATLALKSSAGFTRIVPSTVVVIGYGIAFYLLATVLKALPVGMVYAIWSGAGIVLISLFGVLVFGDTLNLPMMLGIALIVAGIIILNMYSNVAPH